MAVKAYRSQTSNTSPDTTSAISEYDSYHQAFYAFDGEGRSSWKSEENLDTEPSPWWLKIELEDFEKFFKFEIFMVNPEGAGPSLRNTIDGPADFTIEGSINDTDWDVLYTAEDLVWDDYETKVFSFGSPDYYKYYKINVTDSGSLNYIYFDEITMYYKVPEIFSDIREVATFNFTEHFEDTRTLESISISSFADRRDVQTLHMTSFLDKRDIYTGIAVIFSDRRKVSRRLNYSRFYDIRRSSEDDGANISPIHIQRVNS